MPSRPKAGRVGRRRKVYNYDEADMAKKSKIKSKLSFKKGKAIKPKLGRGTGGVIPVSVRMKVDYDRKKGGKRNG